MISSDDDEDALLYNEVAQYERNVTMNEQRFQLNLNSEDDEDDQQLYDAVGRYEDNCQQSPGELQEFLSFFISSKRLKLESKFVHAATTC